MCIYIMHTYTYILIYIYTHVFLWIYTYIYMYVCKYIYIYIYTHTHTLHILTCICVYTSFKIYLLSFKRFYPGPCMICKFIKYISFSYKDTCLKISFKTLKLKRETVFFFFLNETVLVFSNYQFCKIIAWLLALNQQLPWVMIVSDNSFDIP